MRYPWDNLTFILKSFRNLLYRAWTEVRFNRSRRMRRLRRSLADIWGLGCDLSTNLGDHLLSCRANGIRKNPLKANPSRASPPVEFLVGHGLP